MLFKKVIFFHMILSPFSVIFVVLSFLINTIGSSTVPRLDNAPLFIPVIPPVKTINICADEIKDSLMDSFVVSKVILYKNLTKKYEQETQLMSSLLLSLIHAESAGDRFAKSKAGARGLVQFTPIAIEDVKRITGIRINAYKENEALWGAAKFMRHYINKYKSKYGLSDYEATRYAAIHFLGGGDSVKLYRKGKIVIDKYTGISVSDYANALLKRSRLYCEL